MSFDFMFRKKSLGQHFLNAPYYLDVIVDAADIQQGERVLEIGPGEGTLTHTLLARGAVVTAIEKDHRLIPILTEKFANEIQSKKFFLYEGDALTLPEEDGSYKLVANIPYYITGAIIKKFLTAKNQPIQMVLLIQKEVAERIAKDKKESLLSLSVKAYGEPEYVDTVPRGAFSPPPQVDSAILSIKNISRKNFANDTEEEKFFALIHAGFAHKRKLLVRNLETILGTTSAPTLENLGIPIQARAEDVTLSNWLAIAKS